MNKQIKETIREKISNGYAETHVGYHAEYRMWHGEWQRGCYAQIAALYGGTIRIYGESYAELLENIEVAQEVGQF
jgi:hypothetical protein